MKQVKANNDCEVKLELQQVKNNNCEVKLELKHGMFFASKPKVRDFELLYHWNNYLIMRGHRIMSTNHVRKC
jgi:hypothetical protein